MYASTARRIASAREIFSLWQIADSAFSAFSGNSMIVRMAIIIYRHHMMSQHCFGGLDNLKLKAIPIFVLDPGIEVSERDDQRRKTERGFGRIAVSPRADRDQLTLSIRCEHEAGSNVFARQIRGTPKDDIRLHTGSQILDHIVDRNT